MYATNTRNVVAFCLALLLLCQPPLLIAATPHCCIEAGLKIFGYKHLAFVSWTQWLFCATREVIIVAVRWRWRQCQHLGEVYPPLPSACLPAYLNSTLKIVVHCTWNKIYEWNMNFADNNYSTKHSTTGAHNMQTGVPAAAPGVHSKYTITTVAAAKPPIRNQILKWYFSVLVVLATSGSGSSRDDQAMRVFTSSDTVSFSCHHF